MVVNGNVYKCLAALGIVEVSSFALTCWVKRENDKSCCNEGLDRPLIGCIHTAVFRVAAKEKNWTALMQLILRLMVEAEANYSTGAERKKYVMDSIIAIKDTLNYNVDMKVVDEMIESIILATKKINVEKK